MHKRAEMAGQADMAKPHAAAPTAAIVVPGPPSCYSWVPAAAATSHGVTSSGRSGTSNGVLGRNCTHLAKPGVPGGPSTHSSPPPGPMKSAAEGTSKRRALNSKRFLKLRTAGTSRTTDPGSPSGGRSVAYHIMSGMHATRRESVGQHK